MIPFLYPGGKSDAFELCFAWVEVRSGLVFVFESWSSTPRPYGASSPLCRLVVVSGATVSMIGCVDEVEGSAGAVCPACSTTASGSDDGFASGLSSSLFLG